MAQSALVRATQAEVWRLCAALVDSGAADDLTQESYLRAFRALPGFEARSSVRTWLLGIARRTCADHLRTAVRRRRLEDMLRRRAVAETAPDPASTTTANDLLSRLGDERRGAFVLTQVLGLAYEEAAAVEGVAVGTIRSRVARARADLIDLLEAAAAS
jgi:RNA polymerase sigma-70 factor (ECF subfamily)